MGRGWALYREQMVQVLGFSPTTPFCHFSLWHHHIGTTFSPVKAVMEKYRSAPSPVVATLTPTCPQTPFEPVLAEHTLSFSLIHPGCQLWERRSEVLLLVCLPQCPGQGLTLRGHLVSLWVKLSALPSGQEQANLWV